MHITVNTSAATDMFYNVQFVSFNVYKKFECLTLHDTIIIAVYANAAANAHANARTSAKRTCIFACLVGAGMSSHLALVAPERRVLSGR